MPRTFFVRGFFYGVILLNKSIMRKITVTAVMSALSAALMFLEISVPVMPGFIKLDFSELPALITAYAFGPAWGVVVCLIKNLIKLINTNSFGVGELANFILGAVFVFIAGIIYKHKKSKTSALLGALAGAFAMAVVSFPVNYYITYPIYANFMPMEAIVNAYKLIIPSVKSLKQALIVFNIPFTFIKGMIDAAITFIIYKKISPILKGK